MTRLPSWGSAVLSPYKDNSIAEGARRFRDALSEPGRLSPPIWPCTTRGFPGLRCCHRSGGLLPHLFTLAKRVSFVEAGLSPAATRRRLAGFPARCHRAAPPAVYSLWHFP